MTTTTKPKPTTKTRSARVRAGVPAVDPDPGTSTSVVDALAAPPPVALTLSSVALALVHPHPRNPRRDLGDLTELTNSIRAQGVRQNLLMVPDPDHEGELRIVIGHRRWAAAGLAGLTHVPAVIDPGLDEADQLKLMLLENLQRADLTPIEEADGYQGLLDLGVSVTAIAQGTGRSKTTVKARLRLVGLPEAARRLVHEHRATLQDALVLDEFADDPAAVEVLLRDLGTSNFAYRVSELRVRRKRAADAEKALAELAEVLVAAGVVQIDADGLCVTEPLEGFRLVRWATSHEAARRYGDFVRLMDAATAGELPAGSVWKRHGMELGVHRPVTEEEAAQERDRPADGIVDDAEQIVDDAEQEAVDAAGETRREWLRGVLARKRLTAAQAELLLDYASRAMVGAMVGEDYLGWGDSYQQLRAWLGVDEDAVGKDAESRGLDPGDALDLAISAAVDAVHPTIRMLAVLTAGAEDRHSLVRAWQLRTTSAEVWYRLLEALGYPVSTDERHLVFGAVEATPAPADAADAGVGGGEP